jgi:5-methylcytosine-specific restriction endonuclease McrA
MNWDNYGKYWHIDHIIPVSFFEIRDRNDPNIKQCWSLQNLRPLSAKENLQKSGKILSEFKFLCKLKIQKGA